MLTLSDQLSSIDIVALLYIRTFSRESYCHFTAWWGSGGGTVNESNLSCKNSSKEREK